MSRDFGSEVYESILRLGGVDPQFCFQRHLAIAVGVSEKLEIVDPLETANIIQSEVGQELGEDPDATTLYAVSALSAYSHRMRLEREGTKGATVMVEDTILTVAGMCRVAEIGYFLRVSEPLDFLDK